MLINRKLAASAVAFVPAGVDGLLRARGFRIVEQAALVDGRRRWRWDRDRQWALDRVEALHRVHAPEDLSINLISMLRLAAQREITMDCVPTYFLRGRLLMFEFPLLQALRLRRPDRLAARLIAETADSLAWFETYATAASCRARLDSPERNGVGIGTSAHAQAVAVLEAEMRRGGPRGMA